MNFVLYTHEAILFDREHPPMFPSLQLDETTWTVVWVGVFYNFTIWLFPLQHESSCICKFLLFDLLTLFFNQWSKFIKPDSLFPLRKSNLHFFLMSTGHMSIRGGKAEWIIETIIKILKPFNDNKGFFFFFLAGEDIGSFRVILKYWNNSSFSPHGFALALG